MSSFETESTGEMKPLRTTTTKAGLAEMGRMELLKILKVPAGPPPLLRAPSLARMYSQKETKEMRALLRAVRVSSYITKKRRKAKATKVNAVIIDPGSHSTKAGLTALDHPTVTLRTNCAYPKTGRRLSLGGSQAIGNDAITQSIEMTDITYGCIAKGSKNAFDWDTMQALWSHIYKELKTDPKDVPVLLADSFWTDSRDREVAGEIFLETFGVPKYYAAKQSVLGLYAAGKTSGIVLESGASHTAVVPVYEGHVLGPDVQHLGPAGNYLNTRLGDLIRQTRKFEIQDWHYWSYSKNELCRSIKEKLCYVNLEAEAPELPPLAVYDLPDRRILTLAEERYMLPELFFVSKEKEGLGVPQAVKQAILKSDPELRLEYAKNIFLNGGSTLFPGFSQRLETEVKKIMKAPYEPTVHAANLGTNTTWKGGAILTSLSSFNTGGFWITKADYDEQGTSVIHRTLF